MSAPDLQTLYQSFELAVGQKALSQAFGERDQTKREKKLQKLADTVWLSMETKDGKTIINVEKKPIGWKVFAFLKHNEEYQNYRGFALVPDQNGVYQIEFKSGSLNSPRHADGRLLNRVRGAQPDEATKGKMREAIQPILQPPKGNVKIRGTRNV